MPSPFQVDFPPKTDLLSRHGAGLLAEAIEAYWLKRGAVVCVRRFQVWEGAWGVRSDLVAGLPRQRRP
jgi:hypothetical protein